MFLPEEKEPGQPLVFRKLEEFRGAFQKLGFTAEVAVISESKSQHQTHRNKIMQLEINPAVKQQHENYFTARKIKVEILLLY